MSDSVKIVVTAKDDASDDFQRIGANAAKMGQQVTTAGRSASQGLKPIDQGAKTAQTALVNLEREAAKMPTTMGRIQTAAKNNATTFAAMGAAATTLAGFLSDAARAAAEEEAVFARLETAVEATGESYSDYAVKIDAAIKASEQLSFADDKAAEALANLTATTGDTTEALDLLGLAQDLARGKGIDLAAAANIVGRVAEGNTGILARYGIAIQEGATAQEALAAVQERYAGQAEAYANTTQGAYDRVKNSIDNFVESIGSGTGDMQLLLTLLPGLSAGYTLVGGAAGLAVKGIQSLRAASALATVALGPVGLALAATSAVVAIGSMTNWFGLASDGANEYEVAVKRAQEATKLLDDTLYGLRADSGAFLKGQEIKAELEEITTALGQYAEEYEFYLEVKSKDTTLTDAEIIAAAERAFGEENLGRMLDRLGATSEQIDRVISSTNELVGRFDDAGVNTSRLASDLDGLFDSFQSGDINAQQLVSGIDSMVAGFNDTYISIERASDALAIYTDYQLKFAAANRAGIVDPFAELGDSSVQAAIDEQNAALRESITTINAQGSALASVKAEATAYAESINEAQSAVVDYIASGENLLQLLYDSGKALSGDQGFIGGVIDLQNALTGLGSAYSIIIDGSNALGESSAALADHYSKLVGISIEANGQFVYEASLIDDLRAKRIISETEYQNAIDATTRILTSNMNIQNSIAEIQIQQAPYLANLNAEAAEYVNNLANQDAQQQRNVLTLMDANSQQQLAAIYSAATADAMGNLGANGGEFVQAMVDGLQVTNPLLYDMLQTTGEIDANGVFQFDGGDANALVDTLADLNTTLGDLAQLIADINGMTIAPKVDQQALDALLGIGKYTAATSQTGDATGGPMGVSGGGNVRSEPTEKTETITITANAEPYFRVMGDVKTFTAELVGTEQQLIVTADNSQAIGVFRDTEGSIVAITANDHIVKVTGDPTDATNDIALVNQVLNDLNNTHGLIYVDGDPSGATGAVDTAAGALGGIDGSSANITIFGDNGPAMYAINQVSGYVGTAYIDVVARVVNSPSAAGQAAGFAFRDGGIVGYDAAAVDGIVTKSGQRRILVGEAGPEIVSLPPGSGVTPSAMTNALVGGHRGGKEVHLHFHGAVYGFDDFQQQIAQGVRSAMYQGQYQ